MSPALPLFESLARDDGAPLVLALSAHQSLHIEWTARDGDAPRRLSPVTAGDTP
jgi:hypothetical protein